MTKNVKIDTNYLNENIYRSFDEVERNFKEIKTISSNMVIPQNFTLKNDLHQIIILLDKYNNLVSEYKNMVNKNIIDFDLLNFQLIEEVKNITDIVVTKE